MTSHTDWNTSWGVRDTGGEKSFTEFQGLQMKNSGR